jgi:cleavage stimulation factor subunit 2
MSEGKNHDIFVGNLSFDTTEDQLRVLFATVGPVAGVRIVTDKDTNKSKGFAFVEYLDASTALSAIRNIDGEEMNGRKIRVSYSNNSSLKDLARQIGQVIPENGPPRGGGEGRGQTVEKVVQSMKLHECYDALEAMAQLVQDDKSGAKAKAVLQCYPQLLPAMRCIQERLGMQVQGAGQRY